MDMKGHAAEETAFVHRWVDQSRDWAKRSISLFTLFRMRDYPIVYLTDHCSGIQCNSRWSLHLYLSLAIIRWTKARHPSIRWEGIGWWIKQSFSFSAPLSFSLAMFVQSSRNQLCGCLVCGANKCVPWMRFFCSSNEQMMINSLVDIRWREPLFEGLFQGTYWVLISLPLLL